MHCNLRPPDASPIFFHFDYDAMPSLKSQNLTYLLPYYSVFATYTLLSAVTLTIGL